MFKTPLVALAALAVLVVDARAATSAPEKSAAELNGHPRDVSLGDSKRIDFVSHVNGRPYAIEVSLPEAPPPREGYPVIYVFDGDGYFLSVVEAARTNDSAPQAIVVGLGYPHDPAWAARTLEPVKDKFPGISAEAAFDEAYSRARLYDLTTAADDPTLARLNATGQRLTRDDTGGLDDFLKTIETEVKPRVYALARVNKNDQVLFGHSLGGLAVLEALFTEPRAFRTFVAASPSIWWADKSILSKQPAFAGQVEAGQVAPRVLITVGSDEQSPPEHLPPEYESKRAEITAAVLAARMVDNACALAARLHALRGVKGYEVPDCAVFQDQNHGISPWPAIGRAVAFAFPGS